MTILIMLTNIFSRTSPPSDMWITSMICDTVLIGLFMLIKSRILHG